MLNWIVPALKLIHGRSIQLFASTCTLHCCSALRLPKLLKVKLPAAAILKKITSESTKVAAVNASASQRAIVFGVTITTSAPITGSRIIQVRGLANITVLSSLHEVDQHKDERDQYHNTPEDTHHVDLHPARLDMAQVAARRRYKARRAVDQAVHHVGIEGLLNVRNAKHHVADQQIVEIVEVELAQYDAMQDTQRCVVFHHLGHSFQANATVEPVGPSKTCQGNYDTEPGLPVAKNSRYVQIWSPWLDIAKEARPVAGDNRSNCEQNEGKSDGNGRFVWFACTTIGSTPEAAICAICAAEGQDVGTQHVEGCETGRQQCNNP